MSTHSTGGQCFTKPTVAWMDGAVMGSGVGLTIYNTHRIAGPNYLFAMPEAAIGFFPDVGGTYFLSRLPDHVGRYLALTGRTLGRDDALALGLATHRAEPEAMAGVFEDLANAEPIDPLLARELSTTPEDVPPLAPYRSLIADVFAANSVKAILAGLDTVSGADEAWAREVASDIRANSPTSCALALRQMIIGPDLTLDAALQLEYRLARFMIRHPDLAEGVRARLVEKDHAPRWDSKPPDEATLDRLFDVTTVVAEDRLDLPPAPSVPKALAPMS